jgi:hypothetical protein
VRSKFYYALPSQIGPEDKRALERYHDSDTAGTTEYARKGNMVFYKIDGSLLSPEGKLTGERNSGVFAFDGKLKTESAGDGRHFAIGTNAVWIDTKAPCQASIPITIHLESSGR